MELYLTKFKSERGDAEVQVPKKKGFNIVVEVQLLHPLVSSTQAPPYGEKLSVEVHTRYEAFLLVSMILGNDATITESNDIFNQQQQHIKAVVSAGHHEYGGDFPATEIWGFDDTEPIDNEKYDFDFRAAFIAKTGITDATDDFDYSWETILQIDAERSVVEEGLARLIEEIDCNPSGDDDVFDYWPSGVRLALQVAALLGPPWPDRVIVVAHKVIEAVEGEDPALAGRADGPFKSELLDKVGLE